MSNPFLTLKQDDNFIVNRDNENYRVGPLGIYEFVHADRPVSNPTSDMWLHIKHVRGGKLSLRCQERQFTQVVCLGVGKSINWAVDWSDNANGLKRYGHSLMLYGQRNGNSGDDYFIYGDAGITETWDTITGGRGIISAHGWNPDNWFGSAPWTTDTNDGQNGIYIYPEAEINGHTVPNDFSYLVYLNEDRGTDDFHQLFYGTDDTCTFELGELTNTKNVTNWKGFFQGSRFVPSLRHLDTSNGTNFMRMFQGAWFSDPGTAKFLKTGKGTNFEQMFYESHNFDADVGDWDMSNATNCKQMFDNCHEFTCNGRKRKGSGIDKWRPEKLNNDGIKNMFYRCHSLEYDASSWRLPLVDEITDGLSFNEKTILRLSAANNHETVLDYGETDMNLPWERLNRSTKQTKQIYWAATRFLKNPQTGATGALDAERRKLWQAWVDDVDANLESGNYQSIVNMFPVGSNETDSGSQAKIDQLKIDDDALVAAHAP